VDSPQLERLSAWLRAHPLPVDVGLAALFFLVFSVLMGAGSGSGDDAVFGLLLSVPLVWRRRAPVAGAGAGGGWGVV
jgi:hypothetical protein